MAKKKNENKKNNKRRLLLLLLLLIFTIAVGSMGTYAWFTSNKEVAVSDLQVKISASNGIEISADAIEWGTILKRDDLVNPQQYGSNINQLPTMMSAVSTVGNRKEVSVGSGDYLLDMYNSSVLDVCPDGYFDADTQICTAEKDYYLDPYVTAEAECHEDQCANFIAFDIFLKVDADATVKLGGGSNVSVVDDQERDIGAKNATRVAFFVQGHQSMVDYRNYESAETPSYPVQEFMNGERVIFWEPNYDTHTVYGIRAADKYYGITSLTNMFTNAPRQEYRGIAKDFSYTEGDPNNISIVQTDTAAIDAKCPDCFKNVKANLVNQSYSGDNSVSQNNNDYIETKAGERTAHDLLYLKAGVTKVRIYFWIEGQDVDAEDQAVGNTIKMDLSFTL